MPTILADQARTQLQAFVRRDLTLPGLYDWLVDHVIATEDMDRDPAVKAVIGNTILYLYEYQAGHRTREDIRKYVAGLLLPFAIESANEFAKPLSIRAVSSSTSTIEPNRKVFSGIALAAASALEAARRFAPPSMIILHV